MFGIHRNRGKRGLEDPGERKPSKLVESWRAASANERDSHERFEYIADRMERTADISADITWFHNESFIEHIQAKLDQLRKDGEQRRYTC